MEVATWIGIGGLLFFLLLLIVGVHISVALSLMGLIGASILLGPGNAFSLLITTFFYRAFHARLVVLPLFIAVGLVASMGGISRDTYDSLNLWLSRVRGGLGIATVAGCTFFGAVCGSSLVTASVFAKVSAPDMRRKGYSKRLAYGLTSAAGAIGMLIPPSVLIIFYSIMTEESPGKLLIAGLTPGILLLIVFSIGIWVIGQLNPSSVGGAAAVATVTWRQRFISVRLLWPIFVVAGIIICGVFFGVFSITESAAFAVATVAIVTWISKGNLRGISTAISETASITGMIFFIFMGAFIFARFLTLSGLSPVILDLLLGLELSHTGFTIMMCIMYLILGTFLDAGGCIMVTVPVIYPAVIAMGIDPIWYGMCVILAVEVGLITPPVGLNVYAVKGVAEDDVTLEDVFIGAFPFFFMMLVALAIVIAFPVLSTTLPSMMID